MLKYILGPRLYRIFTLDSNGRQNLDHQYEVNKLEWFGESFIYTISYALSLTYYCSPLVGYYVYRGVVASPHQLVFYLKFVLSVSFGLAISHVIRGIGRTCNQDYINFLEVLTAAKKDKAQRGVLQLYDFDFSEWPVDFRWDESSIKSKVTATPVSDYEEQPTMFNRLFGVPISVMDYCLAHILARPMTFPGSVKLLQHAMSQPITEGRIQLLQKKGRRAKLLCENGNEVDTMFIDRRSNIHEEGNTLVICCEGNAAFYEVGCMGTPMKGGYSTLGWNHPGFLGSTGQPFPDQERQSVDTVMKYAVTKLGFKEDEIVFFSWSIGGYASTYAAMMYPNIKALILDATFDNVLQLGAARMPSFAVGIVKRVIQKYMYLNNTRHIVQYDGPIRFIRRQREEIITTSPQVPATNRGNFLLWKVLTFRYPNIITEKSTKALWELLSARDSNGQEAVIQKIGGLDEEMCETKLTLSEKPVFPLTELGKNWSEEEKVEITLYLATQYMDHFDATHCIALPISYFQMPWQHRIRR